MTKHHSCPGTTRVQSRLVWKATLNSSLVSANFFSARFYVSRWSSARVPRAAKQPVRLSPCRISSKSTWYNPELPLVGTRTIVNLYASWHPPRVTKYNKCGSTCESDIRGNIFPLDLRRNNSVYSATSEIRSLSLTTSWNERSANRGSASDRSCNNKNVKQSIRRVCRRIISYKNSTTISWQQWLDQLNSLFTNLIS